MPCARSGKPTGSRRPISHQSVSASIEAACWSERCTDSFSVVAEAIVTKGIIVLGLLGLIACSASSGDESGTNKNAPAGASDSNAGANDTNEVSSGATEAPTDVSGDPALAQRDPQTVFIPLLDWSFENASADCNGWLVSGGLDGIRAIPARTGDYSCKVCSDGVSASLGLSQKLGSVGKGHYTMSAYVRKRATNSAPAQAMATVTAHGAYGTTTREVAPSVDVVETAWQRITTAIDIPEDASSVDITVGSQDAASGDCLFVDDVVFTQSL